MACHSPELAPVTQTSASCLFWRERTRLSGRFIGRPRCDVAKDLLGQLFQLLASSSLGGAQVFGLFVRVLHAGTTARYLKSARGPSDKHKEKEKDFWWHERGSFSRRETWVQRSVFACAPTPVRCRSGSTEACTIAALIEEHEQAAPTHDDPRGDG
jgi:hypothetical protein